MHDDPGQMSPKMRHAIHEIERIMTENDFGGGCILVSEAEATVHVRLTTAWNGIRQHGNMVVLEFKKNDARGVAATKHMATVINEVSHQWFHATETMLEILKTHTERVKPVADLSDADLPHAKQAQDILTNLIYLNRKDKTL